MLQLPGASLRFLEFPGASLIILEFPGIYWSFLEFLGVFLEFLEVFWGVSWILLIVSLYFIELLEVLKMKKISTLINLVPATSKQVAQKLS